MSFKKVTMWKVICDKCWKDSTENSDFWAFVSKDEAEEDAVDYHSFIWISDWISYKHFCEDCQDE